MSSDCVVHLTPSFGCGGLERVIANLTHSKEAKTKRHVIISLTDDLTFSYALPSNVECLTINKKPGLDLHAHIRLFFLLRKLKATVLHTYNFGTIEYHPISKLAGVKINIHADHGLGGDDPNGNNKTHNRFRKIMSFFIHHYIVVSDNLKDWVVNTVGVNEKKVHFIFNGVPVPEFIAPKGKKKNRGESFNLLIIGRLAPVKNHKNLFEAMQIFSEKRGVFMRCDVVGDGPLLESLKSLANKKMTRTVFHGLQQDIEPFLKDCDGLILSSNYEAMPMTVLEAMAYGRNVICPNVGGVMSFISHEEAIITKDNSPQELAKGIERLYFARNVEPLRLRGYEKVKSNYSVDIMAKSYMSLYNNRYSNKV